MCESSRVTEGIHDFMITSYSIGMQWACFEEHFPGAMENPEEVSLSHQGRHYYSRGCKVGALLPQGDKSVLFTSLVPRLPCRYI